MVRLSWFQIPVLDIERAARFYSALFQIEVIVQDKRKNHGGQIGILVDSNGVLGTLTQSDPTVFKPSQQEGCFLYLNADDEDLQQLLARAVAAGGQVLLPVTQIEPTGRRGYLAWILDSEGNRIGLHSLSSSDVAIFPGGEYAIQQAS